LPGHRERRPASGRISKRYGQPIVASAIGRRLARWLPSVAVVACLIERPLLARFTADGGVERSRLTPAGLAAALHRGAVA
jgi:hypothetical protein